jgi:hypothetical protein
MNARDEDRLDRWLDHALRQYGTAEPRLGLEERLIAKLASKGRTAHLRLQILLPLYALVAAAVCVAIWVRVASQHAITPQTPVRTLESKTAGEHRQMPPKAVAFERPRGKRPTPKHAAAAIKSAKVKQFPSPRPLTQEELLFARYAEQFPEDAMLIAQEQRKFEEGTRRAENELRDSATEPDRKR